MKRFLSWLESRLPKTTITVNGRPYLTRCYFFGKDRSWGNVYLHHFHASDQGVELHSHPWKWGCSLVISGGYVEERARDPLTWERGQEKEHDSLSLQRHPPHIWRLDVGPGKINVIRSTDFHRVDLKDEVSGAWTLFFAGPRTAVGVS